MVSGMCLNKNIIFNNFIQILRTDGNFEDERFIKIKPDIVRNQEIAEIKMTVLKQKDEDYRLTVNPNFKLNDLSIISLECDNPGKKNQIEQSDEIKNINYFTLETNKNLIENPTIQGASTVVTTKEPICIISVRDYFAASHRDLNNWDERSFFQYFWDALSFQNLFFYTFFRSSLMTPHFIRITLFFIQVNFFFVINCMMYTDDYIDQRISYLSIVILNYK